MTKELTEKQVDQIKDLYRKIRFEYRANSGCHTIEIDDETGEIARGLYTDSNSWTKGSTQIFSTSHTTTEWDENQPIIHLRDTDNEYFSTVVYDTDEAGIFENEGHALTVTENIWTDQRLIARHTEITSHDVRIAFFDALDCFDILAENYDDFYDEIDDSIEEYNDRNADE